MSQISLTEDGALKKGLLYCPCGCGHVMKWAPLTMNEVEILRLRWDGMSVKEIADRRCVSVKTVDAHLSNLRIKTGLNDIASLFRWGLREGILQP